MIYSYEAKDGGGRTVTGSLDAVDERTAARQVRDMGYFLMRLAPDRPVVSHMPSGGAAALGSPFVMPQPSAATGGDPSQWVRLLHFLWSGVGLRDLALFYRQFATLIHAGVPIYQCLTTLTQQMRCAALRKAVKAVGNHVQAGGSLGEAMARFPWIFTDFHRAMIAAGETSGRLDLMFARLADSLEQEFALRSNIRSEMTYPVLVVITSFLLQPQAIVTLVVKTNVRLYLSMIAPPFLLCFAVVAAIYILTKLGTQFKNVYDAVLSNIPSVAGAVRMIALARFARSLSLLYAAGVAIPEAVRMAAAASGNMYLAHKMVRAIPAIQNGEGLVQSLSGTGAFPPMVLTMLGIGEQTGDLDQTMTKVAEYFEQEAVVRLHQLSQTLKVAITLAIGAWVGYDVVKFWTGYYSNLMSAAGPS
jgi:type IV pilus assembly protein PilC